MTFEGRSRGLTRYHPQGNPNHGRPLRTSGRAKAYAMESRTSGGAKAYAMKSRTSDLVGTTSLSSPLLQRTWGGTMAPPTASSCAWALSSGAAPKSWNRLVLPHKAGPAGRRAVHIEFTGFQEPQPVADHLPGWKRSTTTSGVSNLMEWGTHLRPHHFDSSPCSEMQLDEEMRVFESQISRTVSAVMASLGQEISGESMAPESEKKELRLVGTGGDHHKRKRSGFPDTNVQGDYGSIHPLKLLLRKGLTVSDVGELGRIIIPKKDAEGQLFPQVDTKEGIVLEMEDYNVSKRWHFRFKYWSNNKSRMYVLENTGEFILHHSLKEHDLFIVYEDGCKKLVVCGQKITDNSDLFVESSPSDAPCTTAEFEKNGKPSSKLLKRILELDELLHRKV